MGWLIFAKRSVIFYRGGRESDEWEILNISPCCEIPLGMFLSLILAQKDHHMAY
jgi:hypothetical protein